MKSLKKPLMLSAALVIGLASSSALATDFLLYNDLNFPGPGNGMELADALVTPGTGINILPGTQAFQGNFDNPFGGPDGECPPEECGDLIPLALDGPGDYGSASFFNNLNFGSIGGTDFTLPDGILLTSGLANPPEMNTDSGFTGFASGLGDLGLDALLAGAGFSDTTADATVLAFDFTVDPGIDAIGLDFMFGSEEFPEFSDSFPEIGAVFVDGVNFATFADGSLLTVTQANIDAGNFFNNNFQDGTEPLAIEYDGVSAPMNLLGLLDPTIPEGGVHSIKIAVSDTGDTILDTGLFVANLEGMTLGPGTDPGDPLLPGPGDDPSDGFDFLIDVGDLGVGIDPSFPIFIDPFVATGYTYEATGSNFATVVLPTGIGDDMYNVYAWDGSSYIFLATIAGGVSFDFLSNWDPTGVSQFMVDGIETSAALDPTDPTVFVTGVTFVSGGMISVKQTPIQTFVSSVPEPGSLLLIGGGLLGLMASRRLRKKS